VLAALVAVFAMSALASASASAALPEFVPTYKGGNKLTGSNGKVGFNLEQFGDVECSANSATGSISGPKEISNLVIKFSGCGGEGRSALLCGEKWETKPLTGTLGFLSKANKEVGLLLKSATGPVAECQTTYKQKILGSVIGSIIQLHAKTFRLTFETNGWKQQLTKFEGEELTHTLEWEYPVKSTQDMAMGTTMELTTEKNFELEV